MTDRELMQQALENICGAKLCEINSMSSRNEMIWLMDEAITALRDRLAQPEQELVIDCPRCGHCCSQPNQEPVKKMEALLDNDCSYAYADGWNACVDAFSKQRRSWVGLTKEELKQACWESGPDGDTSNREDVVRWTEARLKEKNT